MPRTHAVSLSGLAALLIIGAVFASPGLFTIDEIIYLMGADAFARTGSFAVDNGWETFGAAPLKLWFLVDGPNGLTPQYPVGTAILGAPFVAAFGPKGLILLNALAGGAVLWLTYRLTMVLYKNATAALAAVAILFAGTFFADYALGVWPHMVATAFVLGGFLACVLAVQADTRPRQNGYAFAAGLLVGAGLLIRTDAVLVLPTIGAAFLLYGRRPIELGMFAGLGLLPFVVGAALANQWKFGTLNPLSYGQTGGAADLADYAAFFGGLLAVLLLLAALRKVPWQASWRPAIWVIAAVILAASAVFPQAARIFQDAFHGFYVLVVDLRAGATTDPALRLTPEGTATVFGLPKKALGQSLPWIGLLAVLLVARWRPEHRAAHLGLLVFCAVWSAPFILRAWHGGYGLSMRYFLPMLPILSCLTAVLLTEWAARAKDPRRGVCLGLALGLGLFVGLHLVTGALPANVPQLYGGTVLTLIAGLVMLASLVPLSEDIRAMIRLGVAGCALGFASLSGAVLDVAHSQRLRAEAAASGAMASDIGGPVLFFGRPELFPQMAARPDSLLAVPRWGDGAVNPTFIADAREAGYRVFMATHSVVALQEQDVRLDLGMKLELPSEPFYEIQGIEIGMQTARR